MDTAAEILTLDKCSEFLDKNLESHDYEIISSLCKIPVSSLRKYIKQGTPLNDKSKLLSNKILIHSLNLIKFKIQNKLVKLDSFSKSYQLPNIIS